MTAKYRPKSQLDKLNISQEVVRRLSLYLRNLRRLQESGVEVISSDKISKFLNVSPEQFRKDLSYFGEFGKRGVGYEVERLKEELESILGIDKKWKIALVGVGKLGSAILGFEGLSRFNLRIVSCFDIDNNKIGTEIHNVKIHSIKDIKKIVKEKNIKVAIITTPPEAAQFVADELIGAQVKGILNFAPVILKAPDDVFISNVDMACEMESLLFFIKQEKPNI
jgi:redox-sensing transcriptional repressor